MNEANLSEILQSSFAFLVNSLKSSSSPLSFLAQVRGTAQQAITVLQRNAVNVPAFLRCLSSNEVQPFQSLVLALGQLFGYLSISSQKAAELCAPSMVERAWKLSLSTEHLLATGGDNRIALHPSTRLNSYHCGYKPDGNQLELSSTTVSTISTGAWNDVERTRSAIVNGRCEGDGEARDRVVFIEHKLRRYLGLSAAVQVIFAASGTDCEVISTGLLQSAYGQKHSSMLRLMADPREIGKGVPLAAAGRFPSDTCPDGNSAQKGAVIPGFWPSIEIKTVALRRPDGAVRSAEEVDAEFQAGLESVRQKVLPVINIVDVSKSGLTFPSLGFVEKARCDHHALGVVVDACQFRISPAKIRAYLQSGWIVQITGSKFFAGPAFSGAVLVPEELWRAASLERLPSGLSRFSSSLDWPRTSNRLTAVFGLPNYGLLLRWQAAIYELERFSSQAPDAAAKMTRGAITAIHGRLSNSKHMIRLDSLNQSVNSPNLKHAGDDTIVCFGLLRPGTKDILSFDELISIQSTLFQMDLMPAVNEENKIGRPKVGIRVGQPVAIPAGPTKTDAGFFRLSLSARDYVGLTEREGWDERLERFCKKVDVAIAAIEAAAGVQ